MSNSEEGELVLNTNHDLHSVGLWPLKNAPLGQVSEGYPASQQAFAMQYCGIMRMMSSIYQ